MSRLPVHGLTEQADGSAERSRWSRWFDAALLTIVLIPFLLLKSYGLGPSLSDENLYIYSVQRMLEGAWPYTDFFFAHPLLHLLPGWLLCALVSFGELHLKLIPVAATALTGTFIFLLLRNMSGRIAAVVATVLYLFGFNVLTGSSHWTGAQMATAWYVFGLFLASPKETQKRREGNWTTPGIGLCFGAAVGTALFMLPMVLAISAVLIWKQREAWRSLLTGFLVVTIVIHGAGFLLGGGAYFESVFLYHLVKPRFVDSDFCYQLLSQLFHSFFVLAAPVFLTATMLFSRLEKRDLIGICSIAGFAAHLSFLYLLGRVFDYYFLPLFPLGAIAAGLFVAHAFSSLKLRTRRGALVFSSMAGLAIACNVLYPKLERFLPHFASQEGTVQIFEYPESGLPAPVDRAVRAVFWEPRRVIGARYNSIQYYLWHESRRFEDAREIAEWLKKNKQPGDALFGDSSSAPLIALYSDTPIAGEFIDTNWMRFKSGITPPAAAVARLRALTSKQKEPLRWIVTRSAGFYLIPELRDFVDEEFEVATTFQTRWYGSIQLHRWRKRGG